MSNRKYSARPLGNLITLAALAAPTYWYLVRPRHLRWGATEAEATQPLPGDEFLPAPLIQATHAVTIAATPDKVWPWLLQLGQGRGGFYSYDWIENAMGLDIESASGIRPKLQELKVGDRIPLAPNGMGVPVAIIEPERYLVLHGDTRKDDAGGALPLPPGQFLATTWSFHLFPQPWGDTRLVERLQVDFPPTLSNKVIYNGFLEAGAFIMERKMLLGIKQRAEALALAGESD